jgi:hypothetical protein
LEPTQDQVVYIIQTKVKRVEERFKLVHIGGVGKEALFETVSRGWFAVFEGSWEALGLGSEKPPLDPGDEIIISIQRSKHAKSQPTSK